MTDRNKELINDLNKRLSTYETASEQIKFLNEYRVNLLEGYSIPRESGFMAIFELNNPVIKRIDSLIEQIKKTHNDLAELKEHDQDNQKTKNEIEIKIQDRFKFEWLGSQRDLAELFIRLQQKGWIKAIRPETIKKAFTKSATIQEYTKECNWDLKVFNSEEQKFENILKNKLIDNQ